LQFEEANKNTRNLQTVQAYMLSLDVGIWSGFKRMMEIAEGFLQPLLTVSTGHAMLGKSGKQMLTRDVLDDEARRSLFVPARTGFPCPIGHRLERAA
jgi:hypothetical protein